MDTDAKHEYESQCQSLKLGIPGKLENELRAARSDFSGDLWSLWERRSEGTVVFSAKVGYLLSLSTNFVSWDALFKT